jgi:signal transduction histidine kinase
LPPGSYVFIYNAANDAGKWNNSDSQFKFVIIPPYYRTWWFYLLSCSVIALLLYWYYLYRIALIRREEKLKLTVMISTQEEERRRMARDLHDDVGAQLSTVKLFISSLENENKNAAAEKLRTNSIHIINSSINDIREILVKLSPKSLDEHGYIAATEELVNKINQTNFIRFQLRIHGMKARLERNYEVALFRITQELINNSIRHSGANEIDLEIIRRDATIFLLYEDNGKGYDPELVDQGYGLKNITTRTSLMNGTVHVDSAIGKGTRVQVEIPYDDLIDSKANNNVKKN